MALFSIFDKRLGKVRHVNPVVLTKQKTLFILEYFFISVSTSIGTKKGSIYGKWATFKGVPQTFGGKLPQTDPPWIRHWIMHAVGENSDIKRFFGTS